MIVEAIILIILCILLKIYYPKFRGFMGEFWVRNELDKLPRDKYIIINDVMLQDDMGTHQIDYIVLSNYGIFVIEMKNYYGMIRGKELDNKWCQYLGKTKNYFKNPIHQNYGHVKSLASILNIGEDKFISIVCFSNQVKLKVEVKSPVVQLDLLKSQILKYDKINNDFNLEELRNKILLENIASKKERKQHVANIRAKIKKDAILESNMICPKCKGKLIIKEGKYGKFIGCSNYPKCRYIKNGGKGN